MKIQRLLASALISLIVIAGCATPSLKISGLSANSGDVSVDSVAFRSAYSVWPHVSGTVAAYNAVTLEELNDMAAIGFSALLTSPEPKSLLEKTGLAYIDPEVPRLIYYFGCSEYVQHQSDTCQISQSASERIVSEFRAHVASQNNDPRVIAYWWLDDYPGGDVSSTLQELHDVLVSANQDASSPFYRPAICGFGGEMALASDKDITGSDPSMQGFMLAMTNFRTTYCDMVALYPYAYVENTPAGSADSSKYDWSLRYTLPARMSVLKSRGWDSSKEPLVGVPQAFGYGPYVAPTGVELETEMASFCKMGAVALVVYSWDDGYQKRYPDATVIEPFNSSDLRAGLARGIADCRGYWAPARDSGADSTS